MALIGFGQFVLSHASAVWGAVGPLVGVALGAWLAARWQRRGWVLDHKAAEYRSLFDALNSYGFRLTEYQSLYGAGQVVAVSAQKNFDDSVALAKAHDDVTNAFDDRIFTRRAIAKSGARNDWSSFAQELSSANPPALLECTKRIRAIHQKLVKASQDDLSLDDN